jgi:acid phosphatase class B
MRRAVVAFALLTWCTALVHPSALHASPPRTAPGILDRSMPHDEAMRRLAAVRSEVRCAARQGKAVVCVFDIDDTLVMHGHGGATRTAPGAVSYVNSLMKAGARIVYLTARPEHKRDETQRLLKSYKLPLNERAELLCNPKNNDGVAWKGDSKPQVLQRGFPVAFFENDKTHVRTFRNAYPTSHVFRLNTRSSRPDPGGQGLFEVIDGFK